MTFWTEFYKQVTCVALCVAVAGATTPVAKLKGSKVQVDGVAVPSAANVNGWPVATGQLLSSGSEPVVLAMAGGNQVTLKPHTTARLIESKDRATLQLTEGEVSLDIQNPNTFGLQIGERLVTTDSGMQSDVTLRKDNTVVIAKRTGRVLVDGAEPEPSPVPAPAPAPQTGPTTTSTASRSTPTWVYVTVIAAAGAGVGTAIALTGNDDDETPVSPSRP